MDSDKIIQELNQRFVAPLPEFYKRRIVFWYDEDGEFQERLDEVALNNAKLVALTGTNNFAVKNFWRWMIPRTTIWYIVRCLMRSRRTTGFWILKCTAKSSGRIPLRSFHRCT